MAAGALIGEAIAAAGGWLRFDAFMNIALHHAQCGYYGSGRARLGAQGDFTTAPHISPLFAEVLARQLRACGCAEEVLEIGAGAGALAAQLLSRLPECRHYSIIETSPALSARQKQTLRGELTRVQWLRQLPAAHDGGIVANEVLDCVPCRLIARRAGKWRERGVCQTAAGAFAFAERDMADDAAAHVPADDLPDGYCTEICPQAAGLCAALAGCLRHGLLMFFDYGYGRQEYYHPQRARGTLQCFMGGRQDDDPLTAVGEKDITAHVDFSAIAHAALDAGAQLAGYVTQAQALIDGGIAEALAARAPGTADYMRAAAAAHKLLAPHEMGDIVKWIALTRGGIPAPPAFSCSMAHRL